MDLVPRSRHRLAGRPSLGRRWQPCIGPRPQTVIRGRTIRWLPAAWQRTTQPRSQRRHRQQLRHRRCQPSNLPRRRPPPWYQIQQPRGGAGVEGCAAQVRRARPELNRAGRRAAARTRCADVRRDGETIPVVRAARRRCHRRRGAGRIDRLVELADRATDERVVVTCVRRNDVMVPGTQRGIGGPSRQPLVSSVWPDSVPVASS